MYNPLEGEINRIYYGLLRGREEEHERLVRLTKSDVPYPEPTEHERTRYMIKAAAIFLK